MFEKYKDILAKFEKSSINVGKFYRKFANIAFLIHVLVHFYNLFSKLAHS